MPKSRIKTIKNLGMIKVELQLDGKDKKISAHKCTKFLLFLKKMSSKILNKEKEKVENIKRLTIFFLLNLINLIIKINILCRCSKIIRKLIKLTFFSQCKPRFYSRFYKFTRES